MPTIYHVIMPASWAKQQNQDFIEAESLASEGFIHCSTKDQVAGVLWRYYKNAGELILLHIDTQKLTSELKYELATGKELFPHVFGKINKSAIIEVEKIFTS